MDRIKFNVLKYYYISIIVFAVIYYSLGIEHIELTTHAKDSGGKLKFIDCLYFSSTTMVTIGYGDIYPKSDLAKSIVLLQHANALLYIMAFVF